MRQRMNQRIVTKMLQMNQRTKLTKMRQMNQMMKLTKVRQMRQRMNQRMKLTKVRQMRQRMNQMMKLTKVRQMNQRMKLTKVVMKVVTKVVMKVVTKVVMKVVTKVVMKVVTKVATKVKEMYQRITKTHPTLIPMSLMFNHLRSLTTYSRWTITSARQQKSQTQILFPKNNKLTLLHSSSTSCHLK